MQTESIKGPANLFYYNINRLMEEHGYIQSEFADAIGRPRSSVNVYVNGKRFPGPEVLQEFADFFGVSPAEFFKTPQELAAVNPSTNIIGYTSNVSGLLDSIQRCVQGHGSAPFLISVGSEDFQPYASNGDILECVYKKNVEEGNMVLLLKDKSLYMGRLYRHGNVYLLLSEAKSTAPVTLTEAEFKSSLIAIVLSCKHKF